MTGETGSFPSVCVPRLVMVSPNQSGALQCVALGGIRISAANTNASTRTGADTLDLVWRCCPRARSRFLGHPSRWSGEETRRTAAARQPARCSSARFTRADSCLRFEPRPGRLTERLVRVRRCWAGSGCHCAIRLQSRLRRRLVSTCRRGDSPSPDAKALSLCPSGPDGAAWAAAVCEKQMVSRWADASCASPRSAAGSQLGGFLWARVGWLHCRWRWRLDWPRVTRPWQAQRCSPPLSERLPPCCGAAACRL